MKRLVIPLAIALVGASWLGPVHAAPEVQTRGHAQPSNPVRADARELCTTVGAGTVPGGTPTMVAVGQSLVYATDKDFSNCDLWRLDPPYSTPVRLTGETESFLGAIGNLLFYEQYLQGNRVVGVRDPFSGYTQKLTDGDGGQLHAVGGVVCFVVLGQPNCFDPATHQLSVVSAGAPDAIPGAGVYVYSGYAGGSVIRATDGTSAGTFDLPAAGDVSLDSLQIGGLTYFGSSVSSGRHPSLWVTDGTSAGTLRLTVDQGAARDLFALGNRLAYLQGEQLWWSDGTIAGTAPVAGAAGSRFRDLTTVGGALMGEVLIDNNRARWVRIDGDGSVVSSGTSMPFVEVVGAGPLIFGNTYETGGDVGRRLYRYDPTRPGVGQKSTLHVTGAPRSLHRAGKFKLKIGIRSVIAPHDGYVTVRSRGRLIAKSGRPNIKGNYLYLTVRGSELRTGRNVLRVQYHGYEEVKSSRVRRISVMLD